MTPRPRFAWRYVGSLAVAELALQLAFADRYGYHRDELYFRVAARHPAVAYDDQGALTPYIGWVSEGLFGGTPRGLRVVSAVTAALVVVIVALIARELGACATGQLVSAAGTLASAYVLAVGHLLTTSTLDLFVWTTAILLVARILAGGDERLWLAVGAMIIGDTPIADLNEDAVETVGWPAFARSVAKVYDGLTPAERETAVIFTGNYGEAGAIDRYGPALGLPRAYSGHNSLARFGIPVGSAGPVVVVGYGNPSIDFTGCRHAATIDNGADVDNEEQGGSIFVCKRPRRPWAELWSALAHLDA